MRTSIAGHPGTAESQTHTGSSGRRLRILTWHVHGNYLYSLSQVPHDFVVPVAQDGRPGYGRLGSKIPWGANIREIAVDAVASQPFDVVIYQSQATYEDSAAYMTAAQRALPAIYIEHDPPRPCPFDTRHCFRHDRGIVVHVTHFNALSWDNGTMPTRVIEHGVMVDGDIRRTGERAAGITVINGLRKRGRRMGADVFEWARQHVPLDLVGMQSQEMGGLGEVHNMDVAATMAPYRFFFTPIRYTSLGMALIEAMMIGQPIVGIAATELPTVIQNGTNGYVHTDRDKVLEVMKQLIAEPELARQWGDAARATARSQFAINRFVADWQDAIAQVTGHRVLQHVA